MIPPLNFPGDQEWYPLSAFVRGVIVGSGGYPTFRGDYLDAPPAHGARPLRAVSRVHFNKACPEWQSAPEVNYSALTPHEEHRSFHALRSDDPDSSSSDGIGERGNSDGKSDDVPDTETRTITPSEADVITAGPSYLTLSFTPLAQALRFGPDPPADVIMRGWTGVLRPGGGRAPSEPAAATEADAIDGMRGGRGVSRAPGDATCVTVHAASEHVFDYR